MLSVPRRAVRARPGMTRQESRRWSKRGAALSPGEQAEDKAARDRHARSPIRHRPAPVRRVRTTLLRPQGRSIPRRAAQRPRASTRCLAGVAVPPPAVYSKARLPNRPPGSTRPANRLVCGGSGVHGHNPGLARLHGRPARRIARLQEGRALRGQCTRYLERVARCCAGPLLHECVCAKPLARRLSSNRGRRFGVWFRVEYYYPPLKT